MPEISKFKVNTLITDQLESFTCYLERVKEYVTSPARLDVGSSIQWSIVITHDSENSKEIVRKIIVRTEGFIVGGKTLSKNMKSMVTHVMGKPIEPGSSAYSVLKITNGFSVFSNWLTENIDFITIGDYIDLNEIELQLQKSFNNNHSIYDF